MTGLIEKRESKRLVRLSLRARFGFVLASVALIPLIIYIILNQIAWRDSLRERAEEALSNAARFNALKIDSFLTASLSMVEAAAGLRDFEEFLAADVTHSPADFETIMESLHRVAENDSIFIVSVALLDRRGWNRADTRRWGMGNDESESSSFKNAMLSGLPSAQIVPRPESVTEDEVSFSAPVFDGVRFLGVIRINYSLAAVRNSIISGFGMTGPSSFPVVMDGRGAIVATALNENDRALSGLEEGLRDLGTTMAFSLPRTSVRKQAWMGASASLEEIGWTIFYLQAEDFFFAPIERQFRLSLLICFGLLVLVVLLSWFTALRLAAPLYQLRNSAERIAAGDWSVRTFGSGSPEISALERAFVQMAENLKQREHDLIAAKSSAEAADRAKSDFLAVMSHEVRTPLNSIIGFGTLLLQDESVDPAHREHVRRMEAGARHLLTMINEILDFSRIEAGRMEIKRERVNLEELLSGVVEICGNAPWDQGLEIFFQIGSEVPLEFTGDPQALTRILANLVSNGVKFADHGGVVISIAMEHVDEVPQLRFKVVDSGPGLPAGTGDEIFEAFTQADASMRRRHSGTGLGLAICKRLIDALGGRIWIDRDYREGASFSFSIPIEAPLSPQLPGSVLWPTDLQLPLLTESDFYREQMEALLRSQGLRTCHIDPHHPAMPENTPPVLLLHWNEALSRCPAGEAIRDGRFPPAQTRVIVLLQPTLQKSRLPEVLRDAIVHNNPLFVWEITAGLQELLDAS